MLNLNEFSHNHHPSGVNLLAKYIRRGIWVEVKIDGLKSILPTNIVTNIHSFRFIGNTAIHELTPPEKSALRLAIEIVEDLLNFLYELDYKARGLTRYRQTGSTLEPAPPLKT